jgi:hypothetical protein
MEPSVIHNRGTLPRLSGLTALRLRLAIRGFPRSHSASSPEAYSRPGHSGQQIRDAYSGLELADAPYCSFREFPCPTPESVPVSSAVSVNIWKLPFTTVSKFMVTVTLPDAFLKRPVPPVI